MVLRGLYKYRCCCIGPKKNHAVVREKNYPWQYCFQGEKEVFRRRSSGQHHHQQYAHLYGHGGRPHVRALGIGEFFRYLIMDFDFDKMIEFGVEAIDEEKEVVNPIHRRLSQKYRKEVEKRKRLQGDQYALAEQSIDTLLENIPAITQKQATLLEKIELHQQKEQEIKTERSKVTARIKLTHIAVMNRKLER